MASERNSIHYPDCIHSRHNVTLNDAGYIVRKWNKMETNATLPTHQSVTQSQSRSISRRFTVSHHILLFHSINWKCRLFEAHWCYMLVHANNTTALFSSCHATAGGGVGYIQLVTYLFRWRPIGVFGKLYCIFRNAQDFSDVSSKGDLFKLCQFRQIGLRGSVHLTNLRAFPS